MFTPNLDHREILGQGLRPLGALCDLRKDAFSPLEPGIQTGEMRPVPVSKTEAVSFCGRCWGRSRGSGCQVVGIGPPRKHGCVKLSQLSVPQLSVSTIISPSREADRGNPKHCTSRAQLGIKADKSR
jgi:hypothetical protein